VWLRKMRLEFVERRPAGRADDGSHSALVDGEARGCLGLRGSALGSFYVTNVFDPATTRGVEPPNQPAAFSTSARILASVVASSDVTVHATGCMWAPSSRAGLTTSPKPNAMKSLSGLM
jgi:hypothetical protein